MIIIVEGPDGSGKTTLAERIAEQTGYMYLHRSYPNNEEEKRRMLNEYILAIKEGANIVLDRCWYSEIVYGSVMRDGSRISLEDMHRLEGLICENGGGLIIYCTDHPMVLWHRCTKRGEEYIKDFETHREICELYDELMRMSHKIPVVKYAYEELC